MDGFSFHPYPNLATDPLARGYPWPNAGFVNLDRDQAGALGRVRRHRAADDARRAPALPRRGGLAGRHDRARGLHRRARTSPVTSERAQAAIYGELVRRAVCDPDIAQVNIFGFRDDPLRTGFQAGLHRVDGTPRPAAAAVGAAIASTSCPTRADGAGEPSRTVVGLKRPRVAAAPGSVVVRLAADEGATARACVLQGAHTLSSARRLLAARNVADGRLRDRGPCGRSAARR